MILEQSIYFMYFRNLTEINFVKLILTINQIDSQDSVSSYEHFLTPICGTFNLKRNKALPKIQVDGF